MVLIGGAVTSPMVRTGGRAHWLLLPMVLGTAYIFTTGVR